MDNIKIVGCTTVGSYNTWAAWTVASFYNIVDAVVVINGGFDFNDLSKGDAVPLERERQQLKELDINNKVIQIRPDWDKIRFAKKGRDETGRARNIELAFSYSYALAKQKKWNIDKTSIKTVYVTQEFLNDYNGYYEPSNGALITAGTACSYSKYNISSKYMKNLMKLFPNATASVKNMIN